MLDVWSAQLVRFLLVLARSAGIFSVVPVLGQTPVPAHVRVILTVALALAVAPIAGMPPADVTSSNFALTWALGREAVVGLTIGFVAALIISCAQIAGEMVDFEIGFGLSGSIDPLTNVQMPVIAKFLQLFVTLIFLASGAHYLVICALADSFGVIAPGQPAAVALAYRPLMDIFVRVFLLGLKVAGPILGVLLLCDLSLGLVARTTPQMNLLMVGLPLKIGVGMLAILVALPVAAVVFSQFMGGVYPASMAVVRAIGR